MKAPVKKGTALVLVIMTLGVSVLSALLTMNGILPVWLFQTTLVLAFPLFVVSLGLWWMAGEKEGDIPFLGY